MARTKAEGGISGLQKAAILLISLGPERSAGIFKHLKEEEIEELTLEIANTRSVTPQVKEEVINEFYEVCLAQQYKTHLKYLLLPVETRFLYLRSPA